MNGLEIEPNLADAQPGSALYDGGAPDQAAQATISAEQQAYAIAIGKALAKGFEPDFVERIIRGLAVNEAWESFGLVQGDSPQLGMVQFADRFGGGTWKIAGVLTIARANNSADVGVGISGLVSGYDLSYVAQRNNPAERTLNLPMPPDRSFQISIVGGITGDAILVVFRLERYGAR